MLIYERDYLLRVYFRSGPDSLPVKRTKIHDLRKTNPIKLYYQQMMNQIPSKFIS